MSRWTVRVALAGVLIVTAVFTVASSGTAVQAAGVTVTVNDTGDLSTATEQSACLGGTAGCTLRAAIDVANASGGASTINFGFSGSGVHTIVLPALPAPQVNLLPQILVPITIDGTTQRGIRGVHRPRQWRERHVRGRRRDRHGHHQCHRHRDRSHLHRQRHDGKRQPVDR